MHCSQKCSQRHPRIGQRGQLHHSNRACARVAPGHVVGRPPGGPRVPGAGAQRLTLSTIEQFNTIFANLPKKERRSVAPSRSLTVKDADGQLNAARPASRQTNPPGNSALGQERVGTVEAEGRRDTANAWAWPRGHVRPALPSIHEIIVSTVPVSEPSQLLTVPQAAQRLGVCRRTLERLVTRGEFPQPLRVGGSVRVPLADVQAFVASLVAQRGAA